jgi:hypothetical protein
MSQQQGQNLETHGRYDALYHFIVAPLVLINIIISIVHLFQDHGYISIWYVVMSMVLPLLWLRIRTYPLKVQDRVIRLEERVRLQALSPEEWHAKIFHLSEDQLIGLRFAADDEVVELAENALEHNWNRKQIKQQIKNWRSDHWRV